MPGWRGPALHCQNGEEARAAAPASPTTMHLGRRPSSPTKSVSRLLNSNMQMEKWPFCEIFGHYVNKSEKTSIFPSHVKNWGNGKKIISFFGVPGAQHPLKQRQKATG